MQKGMKGSGKGARKSRTQSQIQSWVQSRAQSQVENRTQSQVQSRVEGRTQSQMRGRIKGCGLSVLLTAALLLGGCGRPQLPPSQTAGSSDQTQTTPPQTGNGSGLGPVRLPQDPISDTAFLLDTFVVITIYDSQDQALLEGSLELCRRYEEQLSRTIATSEIARLNNRSAGTERMAVSDSTARLIEEGLAYSRLSGGAFDITIEPVSSMWDFTSGEKELPDPDRLARAVETVGYENLSVEGEEICFASPDTRIELGAIAKGYIADKIKDYLLEQGVKSALINLGGNVLCIGEKPDGLPFKVGLQKPFKDRNETIAVLNIRDRSVVTSGVYERCFEKDGVNYHHILDPKTGYPYDNGLLSVTIVSPRSVDGDGLSTACFSLGLKEGIALLDTMPEVCGYFITEDYKVHYSEGAKELLQP